jgi:hypothetical protein
MIELVHLQSSFEVAVARSLDANAIVWTRPAAMIWTDTNGEAHRYYADFYLPGHDVYLDPKNDYLIPKDRAKIQAVCDQNKVAVLVLTKDQLDWQTIRRLV